MASQGKDIHQILLMLSIFLISVLCVLSTDGVEDDLQGLNLLQKTAAKKQTSRQLAGAKTSNNATRPQIQHTEFCYMHMGCFKVETQRSAPRRKQVALLQQSLGTQMDKCAPVYTRELQWQLEALRHFHLFPARRGHCTFPSSSSEGQDIMKSVRSKASTWVENSTVIPFVIQESMYLAMLTEAREYFYQAAGKMDDNFYVAALIGIWAFLWGSVILKRVYSVFFSFGSVGGAVSKDGKDGNVRPELESWNGGWWTWVTIEWATTWIRRYGSSMREGQVKVKTGDFGLNGFPGDEAEVCYNNFIAIWREEAALKGGDAKTSLWKVLREYVGISNITRLLLVVASQMIAGYILNVYLIELAIDQIVFATDDPVGAKRQRLVVVFFVLVGFWGMPIARMCILSVMHLMNTRFCLRITQALRLAVYYKAQRLPLKVNDEQASVGDKGGEEKEPNLTNLINYDIAQTLSGCVMAGCQLFLTPFMMAWLIRIAYIKVGYAILIGVAGIFPLFFVILGLGALHIRFATLRVMFGHERLEKLQEVLNGIRAVKAYGWDKSAYEDITSLRNKELWWLWWFWINVGGFMQITMLFSHFFIVFTLLGHMWLYGGIEASGIFVCLQVMNNLKAVIEGSKEKVTNFLLIFPSITRVERFLQMPDSPKCDGSFKTIENSSGDMGTPTLRVKGSFSWKHLGSHSLHDLDISVYPGELVGVVGAVGSGKSSLLHAMLGEMWGSDDSEVKGPPKAAYCAQVPWIFEGTLKENVIFASAYDENRYKDAIFAASLQTDLEILPGGDEVPIGSRGIALSGGQRARVSLARAAYCSDADLMLVDDPFCAVDAPTAQHLLENLILGPTFKARSRVVSLQPEEERVMRFDRIIVLEEGRVIFDGPPDEALVNEGYQKLLAGPVDKIANNGDEDAAFFDSVEEPVDTRQARNDTVAAPLRDEEAQGRASWDTIWMYCKTGGVRLLLFNLLMTFGHYGSLQMASVTIACWSNNKHGDRADVGMNYILIYVVWVLVSCFGFVLLWICGTWFSIYCSKAMHEESVKSVLQAPIDRFFDKHPPGRIMNRLSADLGVIDMQLFITFAQCTSALFNILCPLIFIHAVMPSYFILISLPLYVCILLILTKYWKVMVPLRYLMVLTNSDVCTHFVEVRDQNVSVRAYNEGQHMVKAAIRDFDNLSVARMAGEMAIREWMDVTLEMVCSVQLTLIAVIGVLIPGWLGPGTIGLCLINSMSIMSGINGWVGNCSAAQFEFISMHRLWELTPPNIPQEAAQEMPGDEARVRHSVEVERRDLAALTLVSAPKGGLQILSKATGKPIMQMAAKGTQLSFMPGASFQDLAPKNDQVPKEWGMTRLMSVNGICHDATALAKALCIADDNPSIQLVFQGDWLADGARIDIQDVRVGYGKGPDILQGVNFSVQPGQHAAVVGTTGCGKSTMLQVLLRLLEPRSGRVLFDYVNTQEIGLVALRNAIGFVPQDPVLFSGSVRFNLDPFGNYSEEMLWQALKAVSLQETVEGFQEQLDYKIIDGGNNLSFGQRQLLCLARMVLRRPALLLLDEATSAIDPKTQEIVQQAVTSAFEGSTIIAIAHRLETILDFDLVVVFDKGQIVEKGAVKELATMKGGIFANMLAAKQKW